MRRSLGDFPALPGVRTALAAGLVGLLAAGMPLAHAQQESERARASTTEPRAGDRIFAVAQSSDGARVLLYSDTGPCVGGARLAEHVAPGGEKTPGCWVLYQTMVMVSFLDGERGDIPVAQLRKLADS